MCEREGGRVAAHYAHAHEHTHTHTLTARCLRHGSQSSLTHIRLLRSTGSDRGPQKPAITDSYVRVNPVRGRRVRSFQETLRPRRLSGYKLASLTDWVAAAS